MARPRKALNELQIRRQITIPPKYVSTYNELAERYKSAGVAWVKLADYYLSNEQGAFNTYKEAEKTLIAIEDRFEINDPIQLELHKLRELLTRKGVNDFEAQKTEKASAMDILNAKPKEELKV